MQVNIDVQFTDKQMSIYNEFMSNETITEYLYGGAAGSGKTFLLCALITILCLQYPGTRYALCRARLTTLKKTTVLSLLALLNDWGKDYTGDFYTYNQQQNFIEFFNGSTIYLFELFDNPSDPEFSRLGGVEISAAFIDEAGELQSVKGYNILKTRIRYKLKESLKSPKIFCTTNPSKNFLYTNFYKPNSDNTLKSNRLFVQALPNDNPFLDKNYIKSLEDTDPITVQRLLFGRWEYSDTETAMISYNKIINIFTDQKPVLNKTPGTMYLSCDVARLGADKSVLCLWQGLQVVEIFEYSKTTLDVITAKIKDIMIEHNIPVRNIVIDTDGLGAGVKDHIRGSVAFHNGAKSVQHFNKKTECYYKLADLINNDQISIYTRDVRVRESITEELEQLQYQDSNDNKLKMISKDDVKSVLGRSPDYSDSLMMMMHFHLERKKLSFSSFSS